jgi:hypothetical protein
MVIRPIAQLGERDRAVAQRDETPLQASLSVSPGRTQHEHGDERCLEAVAFGRP